MKARLRSVWKMLLALAGGATGVGVSALLGEFGVHVSDSLAASVAGLLAALAVVLGPKNVPVPQTEQEPEGTQHEG